MGGVKIGVLGGIGPEATGYFYSKLIEKFQESGLIKSNKDFPQIIVNSIPARELIGKDISDEELKDYFEGLKELDKLGADFIVMVCNTIHLHYNQLQNIIKTPIIDLRNEVKDYFLKSNLKRALIIGTPETIKQELYGDYLIKPSEEEIKILSDAIFNFNKGFEKNFQVERVRKICKKYLEFGAETIILGCTEFAVMLAKEEFPKINTIDVLIDAVIREFTTFKNTEGVK